VDVFVVFGSVRDFKYVTPATDKTATVVVVCVYNAANGSRTRLTKEVCLPIGK